jgi:hypothetical protein
MPVVSDRGHAEIVELMKIMIESFGRRGVSVPSFPNHFVFIKELYKTGGSHEENDF